MGIYAQSKKEMSWPANLAFDRSGRIHYLCILYIDMN